MTFMVETLLVAKARKEAQALDQSSHLLLHQEINFSHVKNGVRVSIGRPSPALNSVKGAPNSNRPQPTKKRVRGEY